MNESPRTVAYRRLEIGALIAAALLGLTVIWAFRFRGWYPHDEGLLGQSAERILRGEIPHRDFDDTYTGGLALLHALVFRMRGISMNALRDHLAVVATVWLAGMFWWLTRWLRPIGAAIVVALLAVWSIPIYPAAMPSWYVVFLTAVAGVVLVVGQRYPRGAALAAGGLIGLAALAKITAAFALAGAIWALVALRQDEDRLRRGAVEILIAALVFAVLVIRLVDSSLTVRVIAHLVVPPLAVTAGLAWRELRQGRGRGFGVDRELWFRIGALVAGAAVPVAIFAWWLAQNGALTPFLASAASVVRLRVAQAWLPPPSTVSILCAVPLAALLLSRDPRLRIRPYVLAGCGVAFGVLAWFRHEAYGDLWGALRGMLPIGAILFAVAWRRGLAEEVFPVARRALAVFAPLAGVMTLTQYPFAAPIYFVYVLPLLIVALAAAVALRPRATQVTAGVVAAIYLAFGLIEVVPGAPDSAGVSAAHFPAFAWLETPRGRLLVPPDDADEFNELVAVLDSLPRGPIWAGPDAPEVAFLSGRVDLNRNFFGFLGPSRTNWPEFARQMVQRHVAIVVVDTEPSFSTALSAAETVDMFRAFPRSRAVEIFQIHWRDPGP
ncbi:MAG: hypothetical protein ACREK8_04040 [Gemmatimonadales bacterium]